MRAFEEAAELFEVLVALPPGERGAELDRRAPAHDVRELVRHMLAGEERPATGLDGGVVPVGNGELGADPGGFTPPGGRYRIVEELARGGMGVVLRGRDEEIGRDVAIKVLRRDRGGAARARFVEEAQVAGQLQHPGVVPVYEMGTDAEGRPFFAMKLVEGETLARRLAARARPDEQRARFLGVFLQVCQTMDYAHARGVIHRDLKPTNVMVGEFGEVQVLDWGLAKVLGTPGKPAPAPEPARPRLETVRTRDSSGSASLSGSVMGTPGYMPPEQARGEVETLDRRADVFALGSILCELLTGAPAFAGTHDEAQALARAGDLGPARARLEGCGADRALVDLALRALAPDPDGRPADAGVLARELREHQARGEERLRAAELAAEAARVKAVEERRARRLTALLAAVGVLLVVGVAGGLWWRAQEHRTRVASLSAEVGAALDAASARVGAARTAPVGEEGPWEVAGLALASAERLLASGETDEGVRARFDDLHAAFTREREASGRAAATYRRDRALVQRLEEIRAPRGDGLDPYDYARMEQAYRAAFGEYGVDPRRPEEARAVLAASAVARELGLALDQWALTHRVLGAGEAVELEDFSDELLGLAEHADPDPGRSAIRRAVRQDDLEALRAVAAGDVASLSPESAFALAAGLRRLEDLATAIDVLERAVRAHRGDYWLQLELAIFLRARDELGSRDAVPHFHAALALRPNSLEARHMFAQNLGNLGDLEGALALHEELVALEPGNGHWHAHLGAALFDLEDLAAALVELETAVELAPDDVFALNQLASLYQRLGRPWRAVPLFERDHELDPDPESLYALASAVIDVGDYLRACALLAPLLEESRIPAYHYNYANAADDLERIDEAERAYRRTIELDPAMPEPWCNLGRLRRDLGDYEEALRLYRRCEELGRARRGFDYPVNEWAEQVERALIYADELDVYLEEGLDGFAPEDALEIAYVASRKGWNRKAGDWFTAIVDGQESSAPDYQNSADRAGRASGRAAAGVGHDAPAPGSEESQRLARQSARMLRLALVRMMDEFEADPGGELRGTRSWLQSWTVEPSLAVLRADPPFELAPEARAEADALWAEVDAAMARIDAVEATLE